MSQKAHARDVAVHLALVELHQNQLQNEEEPDAGARAHHLPHVRLNLKVLHVIRVHMIVIVEPYCLKECNRATTMTKRTDHGCFEQGKGAHGEDSTAWVRSMHVMPHMWNKMEQYIPNECSRSQAQHGHNGVFVSRFMAPFADHQSKQCSHTDDEHTQESKAILCNKSRASFSQGEL